MERSRMIFDLPEYIIKAIRLRAVKNGYTTGDVVQVAIEIAFPEDVEEARREIESKRKDGGDKRS